MAILQQSPSSDYTPDADAAARMRLTVLAKSGDESAILELWQTYVAGKVGMYVQCRHTANISKEVIIDVTLQGFMRRITQPSNLSLAGLGIMIARKVIHEMVGKRFIMQSGLEVILASVAPVDTPPEAHALRTNFLHALRNATGRSQEAVILLLCSLTDDEIHYILAITKSTLTYYLATAKAILNAVDPAFGQAFTEIRQAHNTQTNYQ